MFRKFKAFNYIFILPIICFSLIASATVNNDEECVNNIAEQGAQLPQAISGQLFADTNRREEGAVFGGWGEHLRGLMQGEDGSVWLTSDTGNDVLNNNGIQYFSMSKGRWDFVGNLNFPSRIQQNTASIMVEGGVIKTFGVNVKTNKVMECSFHTSELTGSCGNILVQGRFWSSDIKIPGNSNYVGASLGKDGKSYLVWWVTVGREGGNATWHYTYFNGKSYHPVVSTPIIGFSSLGYVYANQLDNGNFVLVGEVFKGFYPNGRHFAIAGEIKIGEPLRFSTLPDATNGEVIFSGGDLFVDPQGEQIHFTSRGPSGVFYYSTPYGPNWHRSMVATESFKSYYRSRFQLSKGKLHLILGTTGGDKAFTVISTPVDDANSVIEWSHKNRQDYVVENKDFHGPGAIFVESPQHNSSYAPSLRMVMVGRYPETDMNLYYFNID